jgi:hypothetical protein
VISSAEILVSKNKKIRGVITLFFIIIGEKDCLNRFSLAHVF